jgi:hypothetical protein
MKRLAIASFALAISATYAGPLSKPDPAAVVAGQAQYARAQLQVLAAVMGSLPPATAKQAIFEGNRPIDWSSMSPAQGHVLAGPNIGESLPSLLAMSKALSMGCAAPEGTCADKARAWGLARAKKTLAAKSPGEDLGAAAEESAK